MIRRNPKFFGEPPEAGQLVCQIFKTPDADGLPPSLEFDDQGLEYFSRPSQDDGELARQAKIAVRALPVAEERLKQLDADQELIRDRKGRVHRTWKREAVSHRRGQVSDDNFCHSGSNLSSRWDRRDLLFGIQFNDCCRMGILIFRDTTDRSENAMARTHCGCRDGHVFGAGSCIVLHAEISRLHYLQWCVQKNSSKFWLGLEYRSRWVAQGFFRGW